MMRNILALLGLGLVVFGVMGWYKGWYTVSSEKGGSVQVEVNKTKLIHDGKEIIEKGEGLFKGGSKEKESHAVTPPAPVKK